MSELDVYEQYCFPRLLLPFLIAYPTTMTLIRLAILAYYRRIFDNHRFSIAATSLAAACIAIYVVQVFVSILQCSPVSAIWDATVPARCIDVQGYWYGFTSASFVLDALVLSMPLRLVWELPFLATRERVMIVTIFFVGGMYVRPFALSSQWLVPNTSLPFYCPLTNESTESASSLLAASSPPRASIRATKVVRSHPPIHIHPLIHPASIAPALLLSSLTSTVAFLAASLPVYNSLLPAPCTPVPTPSLSEFPHPSTLIINFRPRSTSQATLRAPVHRNRAPHPAEPTFIGIVPPSPRLSRNPSTRTNHTHRTSHNSRAPKSSISSLRSQDTSISTLYAEWTRRPISEEVGGWHGDDFTELDLGQCRSFFDHS